MNTKFRFFPDLNMGDNGMLGMVGGCPPVSSWQASLGEESLGEARHARGEGPVAGEDGALLKLLCDQPLPQKHVLRPPDSSP